jgi:uncharacterized protein
MRTDDFRPSSNVEDDREASASRGMPGGGGGLGIGAVIIIGLVSWYLGVDPSVIFNLLGGVGSPSEQTRPAPSVAPGTQNDPTGRFVALVLGDTEDRWSEIFAASGRTYHPPKLRLFAGSEPTPCAFARSCKFGACSDASACRFSEAYVISHEVGHHVQNELGILPRVMEAQQAASSRTEANAMQVRVELQADCLAGVWANRSQQKNKFLDPGDLDQALQTASAIGDDRLQKEMQGYVVPDSFTHGSSEQRKHWFLDGFNSGQVSSCNTLSSERL